MPTLEERYAQQVAGLTKGNTGASGGFATAAVSGKPVPTKTEIVQPKGLPGLAQKALDVGKQIGNIGATVGQKTAGFVAHTAVDVAKQAISTAKIPGELITQPIQNKVIADATKKLSEAQDKIVQQYKSGKMPKSEYQKALLDLSKANAELSKESLKLSSGPSPQQKAADLVNTAANVLTLGSFTIGKALGKEVTSKLVSRLEDTVTKVPAVKALATRNAAKVLGTTDQTIEQMIKTQGKNVAIGLLIKRPIFYQMNVQGGKEVYDDVLKGDYPAAARNAAWLGSQMLEGGPVGAFIKGAGWLKKTIGQASYGKSSFIDDISSQIGNKNPSQIARFLTTLQDKSPKEFEEANKVFKILQETNLQATNDDVRQAVDNVMLHYQQHGIPLENVTPSQLYKDFSNWAKADELAQKTLRSGLVKDISPEDAQKYVVVRWDAATRDAVASTVEKAGINLQSQLDALNELASRPGVGWGNNEILMNRLRNIIADSRTPADAAKEIKGITTASTILKDVPAKVSKELSDMGYSIAAPFGGRQTPVVGDDLRKLVTGAVKGENEVFDVATAPDPTLSGIAGALDKAGLSPRSENHVANRKLQESVVANLDYLGLGKELGLLNSQGGDVTQGGKVILSKLQQFVENKRPALGLGQKAAITDIRQMTLGEIEQALNVTKSQAKEVSHAVMQGYLEVPLEFRGLGDKVVDGLYAINPFQKYYSRVQSALRYTYNPFFRTQERVETKLLSHMQANNLVWNKSRSTLDDAAKTLDNMGIFTSSLPGEAAQDQVLGRLTANITQGQKRDLAGLALDMANARGVSLEQMASQHSDDLDDALRVVVQYPKKGVLASSLARTMNLAFFPVRYNTKVTMLAGQLLAKQPPSVQAAVIHSIFQMKDWLKSDEGIRWQSAHADAIQVFNWLTPINSVEYAFNLLGHKPNSISDLGLLGGLPLGVVTQMLDSQGIIHTNTPYVNPKNGEVFPDYIPQSAKARAATALTDLLGSTFTYPGRILGLPGKTSTLKQVVKAFITTNGSDFSKNINMERLTPLQKKWVRVLQGDTSQEAIDALYTSPMPNGYQGYTIPPFDLPIVQPTVPQAATLEKRRGLPSKGTTKKAKNVAQPILR